MSKLLGRSMSLRSRSSSKKLNQEAAQAAVSSAVPNTGISKDTETTVFVNYSTHQDLSSISHDDFERPRTADGTTEPSTDPSYYGTYDFTAAAHEALKGPAPSPRSILYTAEVYLDPTIGVALGSPSQAPPWFQPQYMREHYTAGNSPLSEEANPYLMPPAHTTTHKSTRPRTNRWKSLGGLFGRRPSKLPQAPFYQLDQSYSRTVANLYPDSDVESTRAASPAIASNPALSDSRRFLGRVGSVRRKPSRARSRPRIKRAHTQPVNSRRAMSLERSEKAPKVPPKVFPPKHQSPLAPHTPLDGSDLGTPHTLEGPRLDVEIPSVKMERYSVMFGSLLKPNRSSALFARRQSNGNNLSPLQVQDPESLDDEGLLKPPRRATSPSPASPTWSLFPSTNKTGEQSARQSLGVRKIRPLLQRSHTAPSALSPNGAAFNKLVDTAADFLEECKDANNGDMSTGVVTPTMRLSREKADVPVVLVHNRDPMSSVDEPTLEAGSSPAEPEGRETMELERTGYTDSAPTQISIARKVSVTRAQRKLVRPREIGPECLVDHKGLTPVLVQARDRRSQRVQIESA